MAAPIAAISHGMRSDKGPILIVGNGHSAGKAPLHLVRCAVMTVNRSWQLRWMPDYHVALEDSHVDVSPAIYHDLHDAGRLHVAGEAWRQRGLGIVYGFRDDVQFSDDLSKGVVCGWGGVGSVSYVALQIAYCLGYAPIYFVGLDLGGPRFDGTRPSEKVAEQNRLFRHAANTLSVNIWNTNLHAFETSFPKREFAEALPDMNWLADLRKEAA